MERLRSASEDEMLLSFLKGELRSRRFSEALRAALAGLGLPEAIITHGDVTSDGENASRRAVMSAFRGYPDRELFSEYPQHAAWYYVRFDAADLEKMRYISYSYWDELSNGTSSPIAAAETIRKGRMVYEVPNDNFLNAAAFLRAGGCFDPIILLAKGETYTAIEGHVRLTAYAMVPGSFRDTFGYVGYESGEACREPAGGSTKK